MTIKNQLYNYIKDNYINNKPILLTELYQSFPNVSESTIRENMRRFILEDKIIRIKNGVYGYPDPNRILKTPTINTDEAINKKYILSDDGSIIGYRSGFYIANLLRLTTQTPSIPLIFSNLVTNKKRTVSIHNNKIVINRARLMVTRENYKLLQVLDLLNHLDKYNELPFDVARQKFVAYLTDLKLNKLEIEEIVQVYPKDSQINFYRMGLLNDIA